MKSAIPTHITIIPDGNRRWARERGLPSVEGHRKGADLVIELAKKARNLGVKFLTVWGFSTENWNRSKGEVSYLMKLFEYMLDTYAKEAMKEKIKVFHIGRKDRLGKTLLNKFIDLEKKTAHYETTLIIAVDYGGRDEIIRGINKIINQAATPITPETFQKCLDTAGFPDPDLIIRTGGEKRLSGCLLWQSEYSELYFTDLYFPDFTPDKLQTAVEEYAHRQRRFGK